MGKKGPKKLLTSKEVAPLVGVLHHKTVERWAREGKLPCKRLGRRLRFDPSVIDRWVAQHGS
jgi:excisionase family DNA binding protein